MARPKAVKEAVENPAVPEAKKARAAKVADAASNDTVSKPKAQQTPQSKEGAAAKNSPPKKVALPEKFTLATMSLYLSEVRNISRKEARELMDTVFGLVHAGVLMGERVPLGPLGKMLMRVKPPSKARTGRNPINGEPIKIPAKKAMKVPRFSFSKAFKEAVAKAKVKKT